MRIKPRQPLPEVKNECPTLIQGEMAIPEGEKSVVDLAPLSSWLASEADFLNDVKQAYNNDNHFDASTRPQVYERHDGLWCIPAYFGPHGETPISAQDTRRVQLVPQVNGEPQWNGRLVVLPHDRPLLWRLCKEAHDSPVSGHQGVTRTLKRIQLNFWHPRLEYWVREYVSTCDACAVSKPDNQRPAGLLQPLPIPSQPWEVVSMDFIVKLPVTPRGHDSVMTVVDLLTKQTHFIPTREAINAKEVADLFFDNVFRHHGLPKAIVSDRDRKFVSHFWRNLFKACGTELRFSTAYHPQSDGQTERMHRVLEEALRSYVGHDQVTWDDFLVPLEVAFNSAESGSTHMTPWYFNHGYHPYLPIDMGRMATNVPAVNAFTQNISQRLDYARGCLTKAKDRQKSYADRRRRELQLQQGQYVRLNLQHLDLPGCPSRKLSPRFSQPLRVTRVISPVAYQLDVPPTWRIHPVFHISHLRPYRDPNRVVSGRVERPPPPLVADGEEHYEVERILRHRVNPRNNLVSYLVRWRGYSPEHDSWVSRRDLNAPTLLRNYHRDHPLNLIASGRRIFCGGHGSPPSNTRVHGGYSHECAFDKGMTKRKPTLRANERENARDNWRVRSPRPYETFSFSGSPEKFRSNSTHLTIHQEDDWPRSTSDNERPTSTLKRRADDKCVEERRVWRPKYA